MRISRRAPVGERRSLRTAAPGSSPGPDLPRGARAELSLALARLGARLSETRDGPPGPSEEAGLYHQLTAHSRSLMQLYAERLEVEVRGCGDVLLRGCSAAQRHRFLAARTLLECTRAGDQALTAQPPGQLLEALHAHSVLVEELMACLELDGVVRSLLPELDDLPVRARALQGLLATRGPQATDSAAGLTSRPVRPIERA